MAFLFVDTTYKTSLGILNDQFQWLTFKTYLDQKASGLLQVETQKILKEHGLEVRKLLGVIYLAGPGFYTGLRLSEGFTDIFEFFGVRKYSFYSFDIPKMVGFQEGHWITKAYKGEYFVHSWKDDVNESLLLKSKDFSIEQLKFSEKFIHHDDSIDFPGSFKKTVELIQGNPVKIFSDVISESLNKEIFYFRAPEDEFRTNS